jgi:hypothetical protein
MTPCRRLWSNYCPSTQEKLLEMPIKLEHPAAGSALWLRHCERRQISRTVEDLG